MGNANRMLVSACVGNIETLRGATGNEPSPQPMDSGCYKAMFYDCELLVSAPTLPATELADDCYEEMFSGCMSLTVPPKLPATDFPNRCYFSIFAFTSVDLNASGPSPTWLIPEGTAMGENQFSGIFKRAGGDLQGDPEPGRTYCLTRVPSKITDLVVDISQLVSGGDVAVTVTTDVQGKCNVNFVDIEYSPTLLPPAWRKLPPHAKSRNDAGAVTIEVSMPDVPSGFRSGVSSSR